MTPFAWSLVAGAGVVLLIAAALTLLFWALGKALTAQQRSQPDPAWKATGIRPVFRGHDQKMGERGAAAADARARAIRQAANTVPPRESRGRTSDLTTHGPIDISTRRFRS